MKKIIAISIYPGFNGSIDIKATNEDGEKLIIEKDAIIEYLLEKILQSGYRETLEPRQKYKRLIPNF